MNIRATIPTSSDLGGYATRDEVGKRLRAIRRTALAPKPKLSVSEWADRNAYLSRETSSSQGRFTAFAYQREIMDSASDPSVHQIVVRKSARVGYTRCLDNIVGYFIEQDPSPILLVQPTVEDAEDYSSSEIAPMIRDTPVLVGLLPGGQMKDKDPNQKIEHRKFPNGASVRFVGANSPRGFRRISVRVVGFDEVDGYPLGAGTEGDQIRLGIKRTETFWNRLAIIGSTPTDKTTSRICKAYDNSDQRRYHVPCPQCGHMQALKFANLRWDRDDNGEHLPETAHFVCEAQGCIIEEAHKEWMVNNGRWIAGAPFKGVAGFAIWTAYSLFPNATWASIAAEFLECRHDPLLLKTFVNTTLGEPWEDKAETVDASSLETRGENYGPQSMPAGVVLLVAGVDVQGDRLEVSVFGFGVREETWAIEHASIFGDPAQRQVWDDLDAFLLRQYHNENGREFRIRAACVDMGGHHTNEVLAFCRRRLARRIFAVKGANGPRPVWPRLASRASSNVGSGNDRFFTVGVDTAKDTIYGRLRIAKPGPGYVHFPVGEPYVSAYFKQLTSERVVTRYKEGKPYRVWEKAAGARNEALDCFAYALAARLSLPYRLDGRDAGGEQPPPPPIEDGAEAEGAEMQATQELPRPGYEAAQQPQQRAPEPNRHSSFANRDSSNWFRRR